MKDLVRRENQLSTPQPFSFSKIIEKYPSPTLFKQVTTGELQGEVKSLKTQIKELQQLQIDGRLTLIEPKIHQHSPSTKNEPTASNPEKYEQTKEDEEYIQIIKNINYQNMVRKNYITYWI